MRKFKVAVVKRGKEALWRDYWIYSETKGTTAGAPPLTWGALRLWKLRLWKRRSMPSKVGTLTAL
jgi:hypothetical protein